MDPKHSRCASKTTHGSVNNTTRRFTKRHDALGGVTNVKIQAQLKKNASDETVLKKRVLLSEGAHQAYLFHHREQMKAFKEQETLRKKVDPGPDISDPNYSVL